jgi:hypothetical protein
MPAFPERCWTTDGRYHMLLANGVTVRYTNWAHLEVQACRAFNCTRETLWHEIAWRINAGDDWADGGPSPGAVANIGLFCGLWTHVYPRLACEGRWRRARTERKCSS